MNGSVKRHFYDSGPWTETLEGFLRSLNPSKVRYDQVSALSELPQANIGDSGGEMGSRVRMVVAYLAFIPSRPIFSEQIQFCSVTCSPHCSHVGE